MTSTPNTTIELERNLLAAPQAAHGKVEIYSGVARMAGAVWGSEVRQAGSSPRTAVVWCHPTANFLGHYALPGLAERGFGAIGLTTRYVGNDTALILENCLLDIGAMVRHLRSTGYEHIVLVGNSGGASIVPYYQAQAQSPSVTDPPGGGPDLTHADLMPADAIVMFNAHPSRARLVRGVARPRHPRRAPTVRARRLTRHVRRVERPAVHRRVREALPSGADRAQPPDLTLGRAAAAHPCRTRPSSRGARRPGLRRARHDRGPALPRRGTSIPATARSACRCGDHPRSRTTCPPGSDAARTLRSWLNQWSLDTTIGDALRWLPSIDVPIMVVQGTADPVVVPQMAQQMYDAATSAPLPHRAGQGGDALLRGTARVARRHAGHARRLDPAEHR